MTQKNIKLTIEYDGTAYAGWQWQPEERTIQGEITEAIFRTTGRRVKLIGAGRTDAGVHALGQVANFRIDHRLDPQRYQNALNHYLDDDIRIRHSCEVDYDFHARFDARHKRYRYLMGDHFSALYRTQRWDYPRELDFGKLAEAAALIEGEHDFSAFCVVASRKEDNHCRIDRARWCRIGGLRVFEIRGNRFLHNMVRCLVGAMVNLAEIAPDNNKLNLTLERFRNIIEVTTNDRVTFTAPARGLYLVSVGYDEGTT